MAHFLSDVTHQKVDQRREEVSTSSVKGLRNVDEFPGFIRCVEVVPGRNSFGSNAELQVWTGDQEGTISIRKGVQGHQAFSVEKKRNVFVYCLLYHNGYMWAGLSDGYLRIFATDSIELIFETKVHSSGITCMCFANGCIFTGSYDWQILQWDPVQLKLMPHGQLSGHQNAVRCMTAEGSLLFSGGDDYSIRCWDLEVGQEKMAPWPIIGHKSGVRALCIMEVYLFSASQDGTIKVWNTQTGQLVKILDRREAAITTLMKDEAAQRIWSGCVDGSITLWNAQNLECVSVMYDHSGAFVCQLQCLHRVNTMKAWSVGGNGIVKVWYSETDSQDADYTMITQMESELQQQIEKMRGEIIVNYQELEKRKEALRRIEGIDNRRKASMAKAFSQKLNGDLKKVYYCKILKWIVNRRNNTRRRTLASLMFTTTERNTAALYYSSLHKYLLANKDRRRKIELGAALMRATENSLIQLYLKNLLEYSRRQRRLQNRLAIANTVGASFDRGIMRIYFNNIWKFALRKRQTRKRDDIMSCFQRTTERGLIGIYWNKVVTFVKREKESCKRTDVSSAIFSLTSKGCMQYCFSKWMRFVKTSKDKKKRKLIADIMLRTCDRGIRSVYFWRWQDFQKQRAGVGFRQKYHDQQQKIKDLKDLLDSRSPMSEEQLEAELLRRQEEIARIQAAGMELDDEIKALEHQAKVLNMELRREATLDPTKPLIDQYEQAMHLLKARGVNCLHNYPDITECRFEIMTANKAEKEAADPKAEKRAAAKEDAGEAVFKHGVNTVRKVCEKVCHPEKMIPDNINPDAVPTWFITPNFFDKLGSSKHRRQMAKATRGICECVIGYDGMNVGNQEAWMANPNEFAKEHKHKAELVTNLNVFLEIALMHYSRSLPNRVSARGNKSEGEDGERLDRSASKERTPIRKSKKKRDTADSGVTESDGDGVVSAPRDEETEGVSSPPEGGAAASSPEADGEKKKKKKKVLKAKGTKLAKAKVASPKKAAAKPKVPKPYLGFTLSDAAPEGIEGLKIKEVLAAGPAEVAGLAVDDVLVQFGESALTADLPTFNGLVKKHKVGDVVNIIYVRDGVRAEATITIRDRAERAAAESKE